ncbi:hypothetical protein HQ535_10680, partial [bacterium]|nr:hypothetical protein [bacterium]
MVSISRRLRSRILLAVVVGLTASVFALAGSARADSHLVITVKTGSLDGGIALLSVPSPPLDPNDAGDGAFTSNKAAIQALVPGDARTLLMPPAVVDFDGVTIEIQVGDVVFDDGTRSAAFPGTFTFNGGEVDGLLLLQWFDDDSAVPNVSLGLHASDVDLESFAANWALAAGAPAPDFPDTWVALATGEQDLTPFSESAPTPILAFYPDGFAVEDAGVDYQSTLVLDSVIGAAAAEGLGYTAQGGIDPATLVTLTGELGPTWSIFNGDFEGASLGLSATLPPAPGAAVGGWLQASDNWELTFDYTVGSPPAVVGLTGQLAPAAGSPVDGDFPPFDVAGSFEHDGGDVVVSLGGTFVDDQCAAAAPGVFVPTAPAPALVPPRAACWENAFGYDWLDLYGVGIATELAIVDDVAEATVTLNASVDPDNADGPLAGFDLEALFSFEPGVLGADFTILTEIGMDEIAGLYAAQGVSTSKAGVTELFPGQDELRLNQVRFSASTTLGEEATFTMTANATVLDTVDVEVLIGLTNVFQVGDDRQILLLGVKTTDVALSALFEKTTPALAGSIVGELSMPEVDYTVAIPLDDIAAPPYTITADDLSQAALDFYNQDVVDLHLEGELSVAGTADLAVLGDEFLDTFGFVKDGGGQSLVDYTGFTTATFDWGNGDGASFDLTGLELTAALPTIEVPFPDWMEQQLALPGATINDLFLRFEYDGVSYLGGLRTTIEANIDDLGPIETIAVEAGITYDDPAFGFAITGDIGRQWDTAGDLTGDGIWVDPFGIGVDVTGAFIAIEADTGPPLSASATIGASIPVSTATLTATAQLAIEGDSVSADFRGTLDGQIPLSEIVDFAASPLGGAPSVAGTGLENLSVGDVTLAFHVGDDPNFLATGTTIYDGTIAADALFSAGYDGGALEYATALRLRPVGDLTIGDLDDDFPAPFTDVFISPFGDLALPDVTLVVANADIDVESGDLDPAMFDFFKHLFGCEAGDTQDDCDFTLEIAQGATAMASVGLPDAIDPVAADLWIDPDDKVLVRGFVPLFGSTTEPRFEAVLPAITPPAGAAPEWFVSGQLSFYVTPSSFGLEGQMTVRMDGEVLTFALGGALDAGPPAELILSGELITEETWESVFGIGWLDINGLRIELGLGSGVTIGFRGDVVIADKDLDASILVQILPGGVPNLLGIRGASQAGYSLIDLATFQTQVAAAGSGAPINIAELTAALPNISLKSVEFSYSAVSRPELCLEPGIILGGDLYINPLGAASGEAPSGGGCEQIPPRPSPSTYCIDNRVQGCFISARMEIDPNGIVAYGSLPGFNIGPNIVIIGDAGVDLTIDASEQSLRIFGSAEIPNVTTGELDMTITPTGRAFEGDFKIFGLFFAFIDAEMTTVSPTAPFNFDEASFHVEAVMRGDFTSAIQAEVEPLMAEIQRVFNVVNPLWTSVTNINAQNALGVIAAVPGQLQAVGLPAPQFLSDIARVVGSIQGLIDTAVDLFEEIPGFDLDSLGLPTSPLEFANLALNGFSLPGFPGVDIPYIPETCVTTWVGSSCYSIPPTPNVYATVCAPWPFDDECATILVFPALPGVPGVVVPPICLGVDVGGTCYLAGLVPVTLPAIPGLCDAIPGAAVGLNRTWVGAGTPECSVEALVQRAVDPLVSGVLGSTIGIPSIPPIQTALNNLSTVLSDSGTLFSLDCAAFTADIDGLQGSKVVGLDVAVTALGNPFGLNTSFDFNDPAGSAFTLFKNLLTGVIFNTPQNTLCAGNAPGQIVLPPRQLVLSGPTSISENGTANIQGTFVSDDAGAHTLTIDWKDGPKQIVTLGTGVRSFNLSHQYLDDNPSATSANIYRTSVKVDSPATGSVSATRPITVSNVAPYGLAVTATPSITENGVVTLTGSFTDPGSQDTHHVVINWGDGVPTAIDLGGRRNFSATHQYLDDNPTASASNVYTIGVSVTDDDTGTTSTTRQTTIVNEAPHDLVVNYFETTSIDPVVSTPGRVIDEGQWITIQGSFEDIGSLDSHVVVIDWKDETPTTLFLPVVTRTFEATHRYLDDDPTGSIQDFYDVVVTVADDDTQVVSDTQQVTINNVTPFDVVLSFGLLAVDENEVITVNGSFVDPGLEDVHVVEINWGDGSPTDLVTLSVGAREFFFEHRYLDDDPTNTPLDSYTLSVLFYDDDDTITRPVAPTDMTTKFKELVLDEFGLPIPLNPGAPEEELEFQTIEIIRLGSEGPPVANVRNVPQEVDFVITGDLTITTGDTVMARILENGSISLEGWFTDPGTLDSHTVCIDWGDARTAYGPAVQAPTDFPSCIDDEGSH